MAYNNKENCIVCIHRNVSECTLVKQEQESKGKFAWIDENMTLLRIDLYA